MDLKDSIQVINISTIIYGRPLVIFSFKKRDRLGITRVYIYVAIFLIIRYVSL